MKKIFLYLLFFYAVFAQSSSLALSGFGERMETFDAASMGMGDSRLFSENHNSISYSSTSTYWRTSLTRLFMTVQISDSDLGNNKEITENHFQMFSFLFPVGEDKAVAFGLNPMYRSSLSLVEEQLHFIGADNSPTGDPLAFRTTYDFSGGISEFFTVYSMKISDSFSFGLRWSKLFGNSYYRYILSLSDVSFNEDESIQFTGEEISFGNYKQKYSSNSYELELRFEKNNFETALSYYKTNSLKVRLSPEYDLTGWSDGQNYFIDSGEERFGLGFKIAFSNDFGLVSEFNYLESFDSYDFLNILEDDSPNLSSFHLGTYYKINNMKNNINLRFGLFSKKYELMDINLYDKGLTLGVGFEYSDYNNSIDFCFKFGSRESEYALIDYENYVKFVLSISSGERWFQ